MKKLNAFLLLFLVISLLPVSAQRQMESLDRGLIAVKSAAGVFLSWRLPAEEWYGVSYNVYRDGNKLNQTPLAVSNYKDPSGILSSSYTVAALVGGVEQEQSQAILPWSKQYLEINMVDRPDAYTINDATTADLDGDGEYEIIVKRLNTQYEVKDTLYTYFEAYKQDGTFMWEINVGPNILSSSGVEINIAAFDFDEDGKAEVFLRTSEGTIFADGTKIGDVDGDGKTNYRYSVVQSANMQYMNEGPEFLSLVDGETGIELDRVDFIPRGKSTDWGDGYGHRANKFFFGAPYLDGKKPSLFIGRGIYTKTVMHTYDVVNKKLVFKWQFTTLENPSYAYQGNHNYTIADVDEDGRDEIVWGGMCVDDDGKGLYSTGFGHGDALHVGDFDPFRKGTEVWRCLENSPAWGTALCDGATGAILIHEVSGRDCGRCCAANISDDIKGAALWGSQTLFSANTKKAVAASGLSVNFRIYWDGDLLEELLDHNWNGDQSEGRIHKPNGGNLLVATGTSSCNWTKGTPSLQADLFGDWREEVIWRTTDNSKIRIYTTIAPTPYRNYTLMHDHQYRQAICWQMCGYNQPPHVSYFLGEGEGMTVPPPPSATNGRLVYQGFSDWDKTTTAWRKDNDDLVYTDGEHVHFDVLNGLDVTLNLIDTVSPANMTVNSPGDYTINASSGQLTGNMGLMKQGLGTLYLDGNHDFSGNTEIWNGRLDFSGSLMKSHIWVNLFGELSVAGALNKGVSMRYGSSLFVGKENSFGNILIKDSLVVEEQSKLVFDVQSLPSVKNDTLTIDGHLILQDGVSFCIVPHLANGETRLAVGEYLLAQFTGDLLANSDQLPITGILGTAAELKIENNSIILVVKAMREAASVVWSGNLSNVWDLATSANFLYQGADDVFVTNDTLVFNDESVVSEVAIAEVLAPSSVMVDKALDFKFSGLGAISGDATLTKKGAGVLTISNHNSFTGKVSIEEGTLQVATLPNLISEESPIGPVSSNANLLVVNGGTLQVSEEAIMDRAMRIGANGATLNNSKKVSWNSVMVGDTLFKTGAGELVFDGANTNKNLTIKEGVVRLLDEDAQPARSVTFEGGVLRCYDNSGSYSSANYSLYVPEGKTGTIYLDSRCSYNNVLTGKGELTVSFPWIRSDLNGNWSNFEGKINIIGSQCRINNGYGYAKAAVNMGKDVYAEHLSNSTVKIGALTGVGTMGNSTWVIGDRNEDFVFQGVFESGSLVKVGSGTMMLTGASNMTNNVLVNAGTLLTNSFMSSTTGTANIYVKSGAFLGGSGRVGGSAYILKGATLHAGNPMFVGSSNRITRVSLSVGSAFNVKVNTATNSSSKVIVLDVFSANGELVLDELSGQGFAAGQSFRIVSCTNILGSFSSVVPAIPGEGLVWDLSTFSTDGSVKVSAASHLTENKTLSLNLYPNPSNGNVTVELSEITNRLQLQLVSLSGKVIKEETFSKVDKVNWDLSAYSSGIYLIRSKSDRQVFTERIVLKNEF